MTKDEIKKALEICADAFPCEGCPYDDNFGKCVVRLKEDALSLIIKQEKKIEKLKTENKQLKTECALLNNVVNMLEEEIDELIKRYENEQ